MAKKKSKKKTTPRRATNNPAIHEAPTQKLRLDQVDPAPYNPRRELQAGDPEWLAIEDSLKRFSSAGGLVWNRRSNHVVAGHQRIKVLAANGVTSATFHVVDLDDLDERTLNVRLNNPDGHWDEILLAEVVADLKARREDNVARTGLRDVKVEALLAGESVSAAEDGAGRDENPSANTEAHIGGYRFGINRKVYDGWVDDLRDAAGFDLQSQIEEIRRRLEIPG